MVQYDANSKHRVYDYFTEQVGRDDLYIFYNLFTSRVVTFIFTDITISELNELVTN